MAPPPAAQITAGQQALRATYAEEYRLRNGNAQRMLAEKLRRAARATLTPADAYVALRESAEVAAAAGAIAQAMEAVKAIDERFAIDEAELSHATLIALNRAAGANRPQPAAICDETLLAAARATKAVRLETAAKLAALAEATARESADPILVSRAAAQAMLIKDALREYGPIAPHFATLKTKPADPVANAKAGAFLCFVANDWPGGLPMLAKGDDAQLKALAEMELAEVVSDAQRAQIADVWWSRAGKATHRAANAARARAADWYAAAAE